MVILSDGTAILQGTSSVPPDSLAACSTSAKEEKLVHFSVILRPRVLVRPGNLSRDLPLVLYLLN